MDPLSHSKEGDLSVSVMQIKLDQSSPSGDSFSSSPDTDFNKKAVLLESTLARAQEREVSMKCENLLIQMLDLYVNKKLGISFDIAEILNE